MKKILCTSLFFFICFNIFSQEFLSPQNISCNNWLQTLNPGDCVKVGDLDISGNKVTVEALINRTQPYFGGFNYGGDIVSKHTDPNTVNYLLRSNNAEITTTNGYFTTPPICEISLNKTYHVAMVYNGISLKFYRNGFLMSQVPASGQLIQNNFLTTIGDWAAYSSPIGTSFKGFINEVRIWNVEKSQSDLQQYMNSSLPNPTSQAGLKGYYTFNNLLNKAGNSSFDGILNGSASINTTNPNCNFIADSCGVYDNIINEYTPVVSFDPCLNKISVEDATKFKVGDTVLLIQMKGATINTSNTSNYGNITNLGNCGNYEFNYIKSKSGNVLEFKNLITRSYDIGNGKVQLIRVPYFKTFNITTKLTCLPWNGTIGGVLAFLVKDTLKLNADIDVSGKGFRGGKGVNTFHNSTHCGQLDYYFPANSILAALKGEGVAETISSMASGRGAQANGGGGGQDHNSGGGGGGNGGMGGYGGYQYQYCDVSGLNRGEGGKPLIYNNASNKIFMGGGGGAGQCNNNGFNSNGGNGGGIVIFKTTTLLTNGFNIISNGIDGLNCINNSINDYCHEGMGGGGAGGTILMDFVNSDILKINLSGGKGANMNNSYNFGKLGPGGGGGGGSLWINSSSIPTTNVNFNGGAAGVNSNLGNDPFGATKGQDGIINYNLLIPFDNIPFKNNIDSLRIDETVSSCKNFNFNAVSFVNFTPVTSWNWDFGDGSSSTSQNTTHTYVNSGNFNVRLIGKDNNGCADTAYKTIRIDIPNVVVDNDTTYCSNTPILRVLHASGGNTYSWSPASSLNNSSSPNPIATVANTTKFYVTVFNIAGCSAKDSITIYVKPQPIVSTIPDISICEGDALQLTTSSTAQNHSWSPATAVSNANSVSPMFTATSNQTLIITGTTTAG
ncbi:MAG: PKD domain-containing protein, partial [Bacteroidetes bacterium]|nr:PKD domain-containing protein [Bacteroidota bacterium]